MPDQGHFAPVLNAHDADQFSVPLQAPEHDAVGDLLLQLLAAHVRIVPAILRDDPLVSLRRIVDDLINGLEVFLGALPNHVSSPPLPDWWSSCFNLCTIYMNLCLVESGFVCT